MITYSVLPEIYQSDYLLERFKKEEIIIQDYEANLEERTAKANITILNPYSNHLSDLIAYRAISQIIIGYNCITSNKTKNELGEFSQMKYTTRNKKQILLEKNKKVTIEAKCKKTILNKQLRNQVWEFEIGNKSFYGEVIFQIQK